MTDGQQGKVAVEKGLPSLLRRTRSRQDRRRISPSFCCVIVAGVLVPAGAAFSAPVPDPPPPGEFPSPPTSLAPDRQPRRHVEAPPAPPAPVEQATTAPIEQTTTVPVRPAVEAPVDTPQPVVKRVATPRPDSVGRQYAASKQPARRTPRPPEARRNDVVTFFSSTRDSRPYFLAAFSLAVFVLGTGTLLAVLTRLGSTRRELV
jgi:hypothetical protein